MIRLLMALVTAYFLIPKQLRPNINSDVPNPVSATEALSAAGVVARDIALFCERNEDACRTGQTIIENAGQAMKSGLKEFSGQPADDTAENQTRK